MAGVRRAYALPDRRTRLRAAGLLPLAETAAALGVHPKTVKLWHHHGLLRGVPFNDKGECLYKPPGAGAPTKMQGTELSHRRVCPDPAEPWEGGAV